MRNKSRLSFDDLLRVVAGDDVPEPALLYRSPEPNDAHDYEPEWDYTLDGHPDKEMAKLTKHICERIYTSDPNPDIRGFAFEVWAAKLEPGTVAVYIHGTYGFPVVLIDLEKHREYQDQIGKTILHELKHSIQDGDGRDYDEDEAEDDF
jgi:hypothetical protein